MSENNTAVQESIPPMGIRMIAREFKKIKLLFFIRFASGFIISDLYRCDADRSRQSDVC